MAGPLPEKNEKAIPPIAKVSVRTMRHKPPPAIKCLSASLSCLNEALLLELSGDVNASSNRFDCNHSA